jgi:hypothetical protein
LGDLSPKNFGTCLTTPPGGGYHLLQAGRRSPVGAGAQRAGNQPSRPTAAIRSTSSSARSKNAPGGCPGTLRHFCLSCPRLRRSMLRPGAPARPIRHRLPQVFVVKRGVSVEWVQNWQQKSPPPPLFRRSKGLHCGAKEIRTPDLFSWEGLFRCLPTACIVLIIRGI